MLIFDKVIDFKGKNGRGYEIKAKSKDEADIYLYEEIGESWFGGITAKQFQKDLKALGEVKSINLRINSPGGDVFDGFTIYNLLSQHDAAVTTYIDGLAASIASVVAMAGDKIYIADNAMMMIHNAWTIAIGDSDVMMETADLLDKINAQIIKTYSKKGGVDDALVSDLMAKETWMTSEDAVEYGLADSIVESLDVAAWTDFSKFKFKNAPKQKKPKDENVEIRRKLASMSMVSRRISANKQNKGGFLK